MKNILTALFGRKNESTAIQSFTTWTNYVHTAFDFNHHQMMAVATSILSGLSYRQPSSEQIRNGIRFFSGILPRLETSAQSAADDLAAYKAGEVEVERLRALEMDKYWAARREQLVRTMIDWCEKHLPIRVDVERLAAQAVPLVNAKIATGDVADPAGWAIVSIEIPGKKLEEWKAAEVAALLREATGAVEANGRQGNRVQLRMR